MTRMIDKLHPTLQALRAPFPVESISWRTGPMTKDKRKTKPLAYIDARDVQDRLDEVLGLDWSSEFVPMHNGTACCKITIVVDGKAIWRSNGAELISDSEKPEQREMALKGSYSDAFKRAAVMFGVGQYLYNVDAPWVEVDERGNIKDSEMPKLYALLRKMYAPLTPSPTHVAPDMRKNEPKVHTSAPTCTPAAHVQHDPVTGEIADERNPNTWQEPPPHQAIPDEPYPDQGEPLIDDEIPWLVENPPLDKTRSQVCRMEVTRFLDDLPADFTRDEMDAYVAKRDRLKSQMLPEDWAAVEQHQKNWKERRAVAQSAAQTKANQPEKRSSGRNSYREQRGAVQ